MQLPPTVLNPNSSRPQASRNSGAALRSSGPLQGAEVLSFEEVHLSGIMPKKSLPNPRSVTISGRVVCCPSPPLPKLFGNPHTQLETLPAEGSVSTFGPFAQKEPSVSAGAPSLEPSQGGQGPVCRPGTLVAEVVAVNKTQKPGCPHRADLPMSEYPRIY